MQDTNKKIKKILICQVKNSFEYLPLFLAHHEKIFNEIHIIDQCSDRDLRDLNNKKKSIFFYKTAYSFYNLMIGVNIILEFKDIRSRSDFTFILDIDEFLPFDNEKEFDNFLALHKDGHAIEFQWCNGLNFSQENEKDFYLSSKSDIRFFDQTSDTKKLAYNTNKTKYFLPHHGNHNARFHFFKFAIFHKIVTRNKSKVPILHLPFSSTRNLLEKIKNFNQNSFLKKIINRHSLTREIFQRIKKGTVTENDLCFFVANYRTISRNKIIQASNKNFSRTDLFSLLQPRIDFWKKQVEQCREVDQHPDASEHEDIIRTILGEKTIAGRYFFYQAIKKYSFIDSENIIHLLKKD